MKCFLFDAFHVLYVFVQLVVVFGQLGPTQGLEFYDIVFDDEINTTMANDLVHEHNGAANFSSVTNVVFGEAHTQCLGIYMLSVSAAQRAHDISGVADD